MKIQVKGLSDSKAGKRYLDTIGIDGVPTAIRFYATDEELAADPKWWLGIKYNRTPEGGLYAVYKSPEKQLSKVSKFGVIPDSFNE